MELAGLTRRKMLLIVICLTRANLRIRTYPDFGLEIIGVLWQGISVYGGRATGNSAMVRPAEAARILVLPSSTIRFWLREVRRSIMCKVKNVQGYRYSDRILVRFLFVVSSSGGNASE
jgi:hypothetical protein